MPVNLSSSLKRAIPFFLLLFTLLMLSSASAQINNSKFNLTPKQKTWLQENNTITVGIHSSGVPFEFVDERGEINGIVPDYMQLLGEKLHINIRYFAHPDWNTLVKYLESGQVDVLANMTPTPERAKKFHFSDVYLHFPPVVVTRKDHKSISGLRDLNNQSVAIVAGFAENELLKSMFPRLNLYQIRRLLPLQILLQD